MSGNPCAPFSQPPAPRVGVPSPLPAARVLRAVFERSLTATLLLRDTGTGLEAVALNPAAAEQLGGTAEELTGPGWSRQHRTGRPGPAARRCRRAAGRHDHPHAGGGDAARRAPRAVLPLLPGLRHRTRHGGAAGAGPARGPVRRRGPRLGRPRAAHPHRERARLHRGAARGGGRPPEPSPDRAARPGGRQRPPAARPGRPPADARPGRLRRLRGRAGARGAGRRGRPGARPRWPLGAGARACAPGWSPSPWWCAATSGTWSGWWSSCWPTR